MANPAPPAWWGWVPSAWSMEKPSLANRYICSPKMSPRDTVATSAPLKKSSEAFIVCCTCD